MKFIADCTECQRLWHEYSQVTTAHIRLDSKLNIAALAHDDEAVIALTPDVETAAMARSAARHAIAEHEAEFHLTSDAARA